MVFSKRSAPWSETRNSSNTVPAPIPVSEPPKELPAPPPQPDLAKTLSVLKDALAEGKSILPRMETTLTEIQTKIASIAEKETMVDKLHTELQKSREQVSGELVKPYTRYLVETSGKLEGLVNFYKDKFHGLEGLPDVVMDFMDEMLNFSATQVEDLASHFGLVSYAPEVGTPFSPREFCCVGREPAGEGKPAGTVARVCRRGFREMESNRIVTFAEVVVYR